MNKNKILMSIIIASAISLPTVASANTMLGAYVEHDGWSLTEIDQFNAGTSKSMAITTLFTHFDMHWDSLNIQASNVVSRGSTPMISLMPYSRRHADMLSAIANGAEDAYINSWIQSFKRWRDSYPTEQRPSIMLRFGHEFNGNWYPWGNRPDDLKAAWRHMHALFEAAGVNDAVEWVWCANAVDVDDYNDITRYYPGDDVVDWTSLDGYNWGSNYAWTSWKNFDEVFSSAYVKLVNHFPEKPIVLAEVGSAEPNDQPDASWGQNGNDADASQSKAAWVTDMMQRIMTDYPAIRAISWFNTNKELSWALNKTAKSGNPNTGLDAYNQQALNDHFTSQFTTLTAEAPDSEPDTKTKGKSAGKGGGKKGSTAKATNASQTDKMQTAVGLQRALAVSRMPAVVGEKLRQREADGFRNLPKDILQKIRAKRLGIKQ